MDCSRPRLSLDETTGVYHILYHGFLWSSDGDAPYMQIGSPGNPAAGKRFPLWNAARKTFSYDAEKITVCLSDFSAGGAPPALTLLLTASVASGNTVEFTVQARNETADGSLQAVCFPAALNAQEPPRHSSYHVDPMRQGALFLDGIAQTDGLRLLLNYERFVGTGLCYLPLFGRVCDGHAYSAVIETAADASLHSSIGRRRAFCTAVHWESSLGALSYERRVRFTFHDTGDYNTIAKDYRAFRLAHNSLLRIDEKIQKNPNIRALIGCPVLHHKIYTNIDPASRYYQPNGVNAQLSATFYERAEQLRQIHAAGLSRLYVHTDGWGKNGYDHDHPSILPPCPAAGGWEGLRALSKTCRELGYIFALHDQYRDYYFSSPAYDSEKAVTALDGSNPYCRDWDGGAHTVLCTSQAPAFVEETYSQLAAHDIDVQGVYLDVFSVMQGDECFHPHHRLNREQSLAARAACFELLQKRGLILSSEEPGALLVDHFPLVHHAPLATYPMAEGAEALGLPVPLWSLVFHDCVMVPWNWFGWSLPCEQDNDLYCALHAGMPYFSPFGDAKTPIGNESRQMDLQLLSPAQLQLEIARVQPLTLLQARLYNQEMIRHVFLDGTQRQQTLFADGTTVTVDFQTNTYEIGEVTVC